MKKFLQWTFWIASVLFILFFGTIAIGTRYAKKVAPWPDPVPGVSLTPARPFLAASNIGPDNAYFYFRRIAAEDCSFSDEASDDLASFNSSSNRWCAGTYTNLDAWLATNSLILDLFVLAASTTNSQATTLSANIRFVADEIPAVMKLHRLFRYRATRDFCDGRTSAAISNIEVMVRNAANQEKGAALIQQLIAIAGDSLAMATVRGAAEHGQLDGPASRRLLELMQWRDEIREPMAESMRYELDYALTVVDALYEDGGNALTVGGGVSETALSFARPFLPLVGSTEERTRKNISAFYSHIIAADADPVKVRDVRKMIEAPFDTSPLHSKLFDDPMGRFWMSEGVGSCSKFLEKGMTHHASLRSMRSMLAVERWRMDHGDKPPAGLGDLVPRYLGKIPEDPFAKGSNLLFRADAESYVVYSVGMDGDDDGGDVEGASPGDVGWRVKLERSAGTK